MILYFHPIFQLFTTVLSIYVLFLGIQRIRSLHFAQGVVFPWKQHLIAGSIVMVLWSGGLLGAMFIVNYYWKGMVEIGLHKKVALAMIPFIVFGVSSGIYMDRIKKKREMLPLLHGVGNLLLVLLALFQISTGWWVLKNFVM